MVIHFRRMKYRLGNIYGDYEFDKIFSQLLDIIFIVSKDRYTDLLNVRCTYKKLSSLIWRKFKDNCGCGLSNKMQSKFN